MKQQGVAPSEATCQAAADHGHMHVLQHLHAEGCMSGRVCDAAAARRGDLVMLKWAHEHGYSWDSTDICKSAVYSHNAELMAWLVQQPGVELTADVMATAAQSGDKAMCELLLANQCPLDVQCCLCAAQAGIHKHGNFELLRWFRQHNCPWWVEDLAHQAAQDGSIALLEYMQQEGVEFTVELLTELLSVAGAFNRLTLAKLLREQGAEWPAELRAQGDYYEDDQWSGDVLEWARAEGCDSPLSYY